MFSKIKAKIEIIQMKKEIKEIEEKEFEMTDLLRRKGWSDEDICRFIDIMHKGTGYDIVSKLIKSL